MTMAILKMMTVIADDYLGRARAAPIIAFNIRRNPIVANTVEGIALIGCCHVFVGSKSRYYSYDNRSVAVANEMKGKNKVTSALLVLTI